MFFNTTDLKSSSLTMSTITQWASAACRQHLDLGADPTECLCKVARDHSLTPHQIEVLAGEINKVIHTAKYAQAEDKYHAAGFPLADSRKALSMLQAGPQTAKIALALPEPTVNCAFDYFGAFGVTHEEQDKTASVRKELSATHMKMASLRQKSDDQSFLAKEAAVNAEMSFIKEARQLVLQGMDQRGRLQKLGMCAHAAKCTDEKTFDLARKPLAKLAYALGEEGLLTRDQAKKAMDYLMEKKADNTVPDEMISEFMQAKVVNGNHPLVVTLKTYKDGVERAEMLENMRSTIDDKNRILGQKIRAL